MEEKIKVVFEKPYKDYTVGQEVEFEGRGNVTLANWCIANGLASVYEKSTKKSGCAGCDDKHSQDLAKKDAEIAELKATIEGLKSKPAKTKKDETTD